MQEVQLAIARRAYELFEARGREHGHDWEDWFRAESELLRTGFRFTFGIRRQDQCSRQCFRLRSE